MSNLRGDHLFFATAQPPDFGPIPIHLLLAGHKKISFGGYSVLLVGDHGQLPPVKDKSVYNIQGARSARTGLPLVTAQPFELR